MQPYQTENQKIHEFLPQTAEYRIIKPMLVGNLQAIRRGSYFAFAPHSILPKQWSGENSLYLYREVGPYVRLAFEIKFLQKYVQTNHTPHILILLNHGRVHSWAV